MKMTAWSERASVNLLTVSTSQLSEISIIKADSSMHWYALLTVVGVLSCSSLGKVSFSQLTLGCCSAQVA